MAAYDDLRNQGAQLRQQYDQLSQPVDFKQMVTKAYEDPVLRPLVGERASLEAQYLPSIFDTFANTGTGAADMSPAAILSQIGGNLGRLQSRIGANQDIQNFYGTQIGDVARNLTEQRGQQRQSLLDQYNMVNTKANRLFDEDMQNRQLAFQRQQAAAAQRAASMQSSQSQRLADLFQKYMGGAGGGPAPKPNLNNTLNRTVNTMGSIIGNADPEAIKQINEQYSNQKLMDPRISGSLGQIIDGYGGLVQGWHKNMGEGDTRYNPFGSIGKTLGQFVSGGRY